MDGVLVIRVVEYYYIIFLIRLEAFPDKGGATLDSDGTMGAVRGPVVAARQGECEHGFGRQTICPSV